MGFRFFFLLVFSIPASVAVCLGADSGGAVKRIEFSGNRHLFDDDLRRLVGPRDFGDAERLRRALQRLERAYLDAGFVRLDIDGPFLEERVEEVRDHFPRPFARKPKTVTVARIALQEGERYRFGRVEIPGPEILRDIKRPQTDSFFSENSIEKLAQAAQLQLFEHGLLPARLEVKREIADPERLVHLRLETEILPSLEIRRIEFVGHRNYPDRFYRRELAMREGDLLDPRPIAESIQRLSRSGALASIDGGDFEIRPNLDLEQADVVIHLREKKRQQVLFSAEPGGGAELSVLYSIANLFGVAEKLGLDLKLGSTGSEAAIQLASEYFLGGSLPVLLGLRIFHRHTAFKLPGLEDQLARLLGRSSSGIQSVVGIQVTPRQTAALTTELTRVHSPSYLAMALTPSWQLGDTESGGSRVRVAHRFAFLPEATRILRRDLSFSHSVDEVPVELGGSGFRFHFAQASALGAQSVPLFERILPERLELRGFATTAGPWRYQKGEPSPAGSEFLATMGTQYRFPLDSNVTLVPFLDAGVSASPGAIASTNRLLRASAGAELQLRISSKLPPPRIILAWNPLRLDTLLETAKGTARLRDPRFAVRVGW